MVWCEKPDLQPLSRRIATSQCVNITVWAMPLPTPDVLQGSIKGKSGSFLPAVRAIGEIFISMPPVLFIEKYLIFVLLAQQCSLSVKNSLCFQLSFFFPYQNPSTNINVKNNAVYSNRCTYFARNLTLAQNLTNN